MRVSDSERQRVIDELRRHCAAGRLDVDEYAGRVELALDATTLEELDGILSDLPMMRIADPVSAGSRPAGSLNGAAAGSPGAGPGPAGALGRVGAAAVVLLSVVVVVAVVLLALLASWAWVGVLLAGWLIGMAQARLAARRR
jgi:hypothetical protein